MVEIKIVNKSDLTGIIEACEISRGVPFSPEMLKRILRAGHLSILEHALITFKIENISRVCSHQFVRHRVGCSYTQQSQRHVDVGSFILPKTLMGDPRFTESLGLIAESYNMVNASMSVEKIHKEDRRYIAPQMTATSIVASYTLRALWHFLDLRYCTRAQQEIRELARVMFVQASEAFPEVMVHWWPRCVKEYGRYCSEPCEENIMEEFTKLKVGLFR